MAEPIVVDLTTYTYGGECMGRLADGRAVFVPYCMPGERAEIELVEEKRGYARGKLIRILKQSPDRIQPRCPHFGECGGCHYQHMDYPAQLEAKRAVVRDQLERIGGFKGVAVDAVVPSPDIWNYRNTVQFHLSSAGQVGFQGWGTRTVVPVSECHLPLPVINDLWPQFDFEAGGSTERVEIRAGSGDELLLVLESNGGEPPEFSVDIPLSAVRISPAGSMVLAGDDYLVMEANGQPFKVSAESFFQVNIPQAEAMIRHLEENLPLTRSTTLLDLYSGVGLFSRFFAGKAGRTVAVELSPAACEDYAVNLDETDSVELYIGAVEEVLPALKLHGGTAIVDPPRAGLERAALDALAQAHPETIAYVSCDPSTLARDLKRLVAAGYRLQRVTPFDMFPQTYHVECIALLRFTGNQK
jgi:23S rRNA (uracil1939-C5)-methyltransferase